MKRKCLLLFALASITCITLFAQPVVKRQMVIGGNSEDQFTCMTTTSDGGLIVGGYSTLILSGEKVSDRPKYDYAIVKLDALGKIQWTKTIGGDDDDYLMAIQQTPDGGYILGGFSSSNKSQDKSENSRGWSDYWIVKLDNQGNVQWDKTIGGDYVDDLSSLRQTSDGGFILGGSSASAKSGEKTENSRGENDYWIVKLDKTGNIQWDKTIGGNSDDKLSAIRQTADKGFILGGFSESDKSGEKTEDGRGYGDYWIVKLDSAGKIEWDKTIGGNDFDKLTALQKTTDSGYVLGGFSYSNRFGEKSENSRGKWDYWVVKLDKNGLIQWDKTVGGSSGDALLALQQTSDDGYILGGTSESDISGEKTENNKSAQDYYVDYWVVKLDKNGTVEWDKTIGGDYDDYLGGIKEIGKDHFLLGGTSNSGISGDKTIDSKGYLDGWLVELKYNSSKGIASTAQNKSMQIIRGTNQNAFTIYPNPAKDVLHVQTNGKATLSLTNQSGKILFTKIIESSSAISVSSLLPGLYYLKNIATGEVQKVVITK